MSVNWFKTKDSKEVTVFGNAEMLQSLSSQLSPQKSPSMQNLLDRYSAVTAVVQQPRELPPVPVGVPVDGNDGNDGVDAEYRRVAAAIGLLDSPALQRAEVEQFLRNEYIHVYNDATVSEYMDALVARERVKQKNSYLNWHWKPLRAVDRASLGDVMLGVYPHAVPLSVLLTVEKLVKRFGNAVSFFVSDYVTRKPDPFLQVRLRNGGGLWIVERWDEPSFRDR